MLRHQGSDLPVCTGAKKERNSGRRERELLMVLRFQVTNLVDASATASRVRAMGMLTADGDTGGADSPGFEMGMRLLEDMQNEGLQPDAITYTVGFST
jgi:hypothetical protein